MDNAHQLQHQGITTRAKRRAQLLCLGHSGSHLLEMDSLCIQGIWEENQHYSSLIPLQRSPKESWGESSKVEQRKRRKPHNAESLLSKTRQFLLPQCRSCQEQSRPHPEGQMAAWAPRHLSLLWEGTRASSSSFCMPYTVHHLSVRQ